MGKFWVILMTILIASQTSGCAQLPRQVTVVDCINLAGEVIAAFCSKPKDSLYGQKESDEKEKLKEEITKSYARARAAEIDPRGDLLNVQ